ncbi:hypothetical protein KC19_6G133000 [Ceratodon purpureus]|uniref:Uncharacterized protein n=1 Tax=Ceratodon purpureus TaxID=3225 RepID=A0A8T0HH27_CERPU|nr:hypothetical protein KC19_6G133000 [Ceratodon purpureus]
MEDHMTASTPVTPSSLANLQHRNNAATSPSTFPPKCRPPSSSAPLSRKSPEARQLELTLLRPPLQFRTAQQLPQSISRHALSTTPRHRSLEPQCRHRRGKCRPTETRSRRLAGTDRTAFAEYSA